MICGFGHGVQACRLEPFVFVPTCFTSRFGKSQRGKVCVSASIQREASHVKTTPMMDYEEEEERCESFSEVMDC